MHQHGALYSFFHFLFLGVCLSICFLSLLVLLLVLLASNLRGWFLAGSVVCLTRGEGASVTGAHVVLSCFCFCMVPTMLFLYLCMCVHNILCEVLDCATFEES